MYLDGKESDLPADACFVERTHDAGPARFQNSAALGNEMIEVPADSRGLGDARTWGRCGIRGIAPVSTRHALLCAPRCAGRWRGISTSVLITQVCPAVGASDAAVRSHRRTPGSCRAREGIDYLWVEVLARSGRRLAEASGIRLESVYEVAGRGRLAERRWGSILRVLEKSH